MQPLLQWKSNIIFWMSVPLVIPHAMRMIRIILTYVACPDPWYFSTLSHKQHYLKKKKVTEHKMCVLISSTTFVWHILYSTKKWATYNHKCSLVFMKSTRYSCPILIKLEFSRQTSEKYSNIKFHENPSSGNRVVPCGRTHRHDKANSHFSQFCERA